MDIEVQTNENTRNISELTATVTKLSTVVGYEMERAKEDRVGVKEMLAELKALNKEITAMAGVQKEQAQAGKDLAELRTRVDQLKEWKDKFDLSRMDARLDAIEKKDSKEEGVKEAVSTGAEWFWRLFGPGISALMIAVCAWYFTQNSGQYHHSEETYRERGNHGAITGE